MCRSTGGLTGFGGSWGARLELISHEGVGDHVDIFANCQSRRFVFGPFEKLSA